MLKSTVHNWTFYDYLSTFVECWVDNLHLKCSCTRVSSFMPQPPVPTVEAMDCGGWAATPGWEECDKHYYEVQLHSAHKHTLYYIPYNKIVVQLYILLLCWRSLWGIFLLIILIHFFQTMYVILIVWIHMSTNKIKPSKLIPISSVLLIVDYVF